MTWRKESLDRSQRRGVAEHEWSTTIIFPCSTQQGRHDGTCHNLIPGELPSNYIEARMRNTASLLVYGSFNSHLLTERLFCRELIECDKARREGRPCYQKLSRRIQDAVMMVGKQIA